jgi:GTP-binding protein HflX
MRARRERAALVGLIVGRARRLDAERSLDELAGLAEAAGAEVVLRVLQERPKPDPATFLGSGKVAALALSCDEMRVDVAIFDNELTPAQLRQIEEQAGTKIVDRTQLILDIFARRARTREGKLQVELAQLRYLLPRLGYTNAGKTTLFNVLTNAGAEASNALFVTLDPLVRQVRLPDNRELLVSDTVGFIDRLPHALVAAFRATLEEVVDADLVLHVIDASATDRERRMTAVRQVLEEVGAVEVPLVEVYNKCDQLTVDERRRLQEAEPASICVSALNGEGVDELVETLTSRLALDTQRVVVNFDPADARDRERIARLYRHARVVAHESRDGRISIVADVPRRLHATLGLR